MMGSRNRSQRLLLRPLSQGGVTGYASLRLKIAGSNMNPQPSEGDAPRAANPLNQSDFAGSLSAQAVIDAGDSDLTWHGSMSEQQQRETIGSARYGEAKLARALCLRPQGSQISGEPPGSFSRDQLQRTLRRLASYSAASRPVATAG